MINKVAYFLVLLIFISCNNHHFQSQEGDLLVTNGTILTVNQQFDIAESMVIRKNKIVYVGSQLEPSAYDSDKIIDLKGNTVMPGLIEPHTHPVSAALLYNWVDVSGLTHKTAEDAINSLRQAARSTPKGQWIMAFGWDAMLLEGAYPPYREVLDKISIEHPIWVMMQSMHSHYFNSVALSLAGITDDIQNPPQGGFYEKDERGKLTGLITEMAPLQPFLSILPQVNQNIQKKLLQKQYAMYNQEGITTIGITGLIDGLMPNAERYIQELAQIDQPTLRIFLYRNGVTKGHLPIPELSNSFFTYLGNKYWSDGSPYTGTMLLKEPYVSTELTKNKLSIAENSFGHEMVPEKVMTDFFKRDATSEIQIAIHAQGDSAVENSLDFYKKVLDSHDDIDHRYRIEHLALVTDQQMELMQRLGITPSFHVNHIYYYGDFLAKIVGKDRANKFMPVSLAQGRGMIFSLHNDSPMYPPKPLLAVQSAVTRKTSSGKTLGAQYAITIQEAIKAITIYPAWQMFAEDNIGSLEPGKMADFIIMEKNPLKTAPDLIKDIKILETYVDGIKIFSKY